MSKGKDQVLVSVKLVEVGRVDIKQQELFGKTMESLPIEREILKGTCTMEFAIDAAMGGLSRIYKKHHLEVRVNNTTRNRWETVFYEVGQSQENPDEERSELVDNGDGPTMEVLEGGKTKKRKKAAGAEG